MRNMGKSDSLSFVSQSTLSAAHHSKDISATWSEGKSAWKRFRLRGHLAGRIKSGCAVLALLLAVVTPALAGPGATLTLSPVIGPVVISKCESGRGLTTGQGKLYAVYDP